MGPLAGLQDRVAAVVGGPGAVQRLELVDAPADYPSYGEGYRAVFFLDPDGLKLEGMYFLEKVKRGGRPPERK